MRRWVRWAGAALVLLPVALVLSRVYRAARDERASFHPPRSAVARPDLDGGLEGLTDTALRTEDGTTLRGWWIPSRNGAAVVLAHGSLSDRTSLAPQARALGHAGYGALLFDWPGHGGSEGNVTLGHHELRALRAAIDFVASQPQVEEGRVGALGLSVGGALVAVGAARDPRIRAIVLASTFTDSDDQTRYQYGRAGRAAVWTALWIDHREMQDGPLRPIDAMPSLGDRALLVVAGEEDRSVPARMAEALFRAAPTSRKELWLVPRAGHTNFDEVTDGGYSARIVRFFEENL